MDQDQRPMNFEEYVSQAFLENIGTMQIQDQKNPLSQTCIKVLAVSQIHHREMSNFVWLFRKCESTPAIKGQQSLFIEYQHIIRHIFLFIFMLINKHKNDKNKKDIVILMKSIGIMMKSSELQLRLELDNQNIARLLQTRFNKSDIVRLEGVDENTFQFFLKIWSDLKEYKEQNLRYSLSSLQELAQINFQLNCQQGEIVRQKEKELFRAREKRKEQEQLNRLSQSKLFANKEVTKKFCSVVYKQKNRQLQLLPNGNIINGRFWRKNKVILNLSTDSTINYFFKSSPQLNNYLIGYHGFCRYMGPLNDYLEPDTKKLEIFEGVLESVNNFDQFRYKGAFKNGLFHGKGRMYKQQILDYIGEFKNGLKSGTGYQWSQGDYFLYGYFEQNNKQGKFEWCRCINYTTKDKVWEKQQKFNYYRNDQELNELTETQSQYQSEQTPATILLNISQFGINNFQLDSLRPGGWINSSIIDIFLKQVKNLKYQISKNSNNDVMYINCSNFQDIFGSILTKESELNSEPFKLIYQKEKPNKRIVFYFNLDRGHFLTVVYENKKLYLVDSMTDTRECLLNQIKKLLRGQNMDVEEYWTTLDQSQQQNSYDCGIYTIFFVSQLIKHEELSINEMKARKLFNIEQSAINQIRHNIYQILMCNYSSIFKIIQ